MNKIQNPAELEALYNSINSLFEVSGGVSGLYKRFYNDYDQAHTQPLWKRLLDVGEISRTREQHISAKVNKILKESLPERIEITPEIAYFLLQDEQLYTAKKNEIDRKDNSFFNSTTMAAGVGWALLFPGVIAAGGVVYGIGKLIINAKQQERDIARIVGERDQICNSVLQKYQLQESEPGQYQLIRGESRVEGYVVNPKIGSMSYYSTIGNVGLAREFDAQKLKANINEKILKLRGGGIV